MLWNQFVRCTGTCLDTPTHTEKCTITYIVSVNKLKEEKSLIPFEFIEDLFVFYIFIQMLTITFIPHSACKNLSEKISSRSSFLLLYCDITTLTPHFSLDSEYEDLNCLRGAISLPLCFSLGPP